MPEQAFPTEVSQQYERERFLEEVRQKVLTDPRYGRVFLQERAKRDFYYFCRDILGFTDMNAEHAALCKFLQHDPAKIKLILMPRYTFKSSIATVGYSLWQLLQDPNERILVYSDATEKAEGFLIGLKNHILGLDNRSKFRAAIGHWEVDSKRGVWNQSAIVIEPRTHAAVEPSVDTAGLETSKVGKHYDVIIFDDMVTDKNITTKELMDKVCECYQKSRSLLKPGGMTILLGTRWHEGELYGRMLAEQTVGLSSFVRDAEVGPDGQPYPFADIGLTKEFLARRKAEQGTRIYSCLYRLSPQDDETRTFKAADFRFYQPVHNEQFERWLKSLYMTCVLDPIPPPTSDHGDDAAITVVGTDSQHTMYLLDAVAGRLTPERQIEEVLSLHARYGFAKFGLETNAFQKMLRSMLERRLAESRQSVSFKPFSIVEFSGLTQGNKEQRIQGLQPWHERGLLKFPGEKLELLQGVWSQLAYQMLQFPHSQKDDLCLVAGTRIATLFGEKPIERIQVGEWVITPSGIRQVLASGSTGRKPVLSRQGLTGTSNHPVFAYGRGLTPLDTLAYTMQVSRLTCQEVLAWKYQRLLNLTVFPTIAWEGRNGIISVTPQTQKIGSILKDFMWRCGNFIINGQFRQVMKFTTEMVTLLITHQTIWSVFRLGNIGRYGSDWIWRKCKCIWIGFVRLPRLGMLLQKVCDGIVEMQNRLGDSVNVFPVCVGSAGSRLLHGWLTPSFAQEPVGRRQVEKAVDGMSRFSAPNVVSHSSRTNIDPLKPALVPVDEPTPPRTAEVFNLTVEHDGLYYANGVLVSNCDSLAYHLQLKQAGTVPVSVPEFPVTSAAWYEREIWYKHRLKEMARMPRWRRLAMPPLAFS